MNSEFTSFKSSSTSEEQNQPNQPTNNRAQFLQSWKEQVAKERNRFIIILVSIGMLFLSGVMLAVLYLLRDWVLKNLKLTIPEEVSGLPVWLIFPVLAVLLIVLIKTYLDWYRFRREKDLHFAHEENYNFNRVPNFVIEMYKRNYGRLIFLRWWLVLSYLLCGILIGYFVIAKMTQKEISLPFGDLKISFQNTNLTTNYLREYIIIGVYLFFVTAINLVAWINNSREVSNLIALFDIKSVYSESDLNSYKRRVHLFSFCLFFLPLFLAIGLWWLIRRFRRR